MTRWICDKTFAIFFTIVILFMAVITTGGLEFSIKFFLLMDAAIWLCSGVLSFLTFGEEGIKLTGLPSLTIWGKRSIPYDQINSIGSEFTLVHDLMTNHVDSYVVLYDENKKKLCKIKVLGKTTERLVTEIKTHCPYAIVDNGVAELLTTGSIKKSEETFKEKQYNFKNMMIDMAVAGSFLVLLLVIFYFI